MAIISDLSPQLSGADSIIDRTMNAFKYSNTIADVDKAMNSVTDLKSTLTGEKISSSSGGKGAIEQTERLFTVRSRSVNYTTGDGDRGQRAYIKVLTSDTNRSMQRFAQGHDAKPTSIGTDSGGVLNDAVNGNGYNQFLLTDVSCSLDEKLQIVEVFGDAEVSYYFGRQPVMFNFSGMLIDSVDNNWFIQFIEMFAHVMRGSQLARNYELLKIVLPNMTLVGTIPHMAWSQNSGRDTDIPFQFQFLAKQIIPQPVSMPGAPLTNDPVINWDTASTFLSQSGINQKKIASLKTATEDLRAVIADPTSTVADYSDQMKNFGTGMSTFGVDPGTFTSVGGGLGKYASSVTLGGAPDASSGTSVAQSATNGLNALSDLYTGLSANLNGIRASLFSPIYGVMNSLTKLVRNVTKGALGVFNGFINPVRNILRDVQNVSGQAVGVVNMVTGTLRSAVGSVRGLDQEIANTLSSLKRSAGVIATSPQSISSSLRNLVSAGRFPITTRFLNTVEYVPVNLGPNGPGTGAAVGGGGIPTVPYVKSKIPLLNSGPRHTPQQGARL